MNGFVLLTNGTKQLGYVLNILALLRWRSCGIQATARQRGYLPPDNSPEHYLGEAVVKVLRSDHLIPNQSSSGKLPQPTLKLMIWALWRPREGGLHGLRLNTPVPFFFEADDQ